MRDKNDAALRAQAKVVVTELVEKHVLDPANLWTDATRKIPEVASALKDFGEFFGLPRVDVQIRLKSYFMHM